MNPQPVFVALTDQGARLARRLMPSIDGAELHGYGKRVIDSDVPFSRVAPHLRDLFAAGRPIVAIMSAGIVIRAIGDLAADKEREAFVICLGESGGAVVPLLGGHHGGNRMAERLAAALDIAPAITTAGDGRFGHALDEPPPGWGLSNAAAAKQVMAALLAGDGIDLEDETGPGIDIGWLGLDLIETAAAGPVLVITEQAVQESPGRLALHPRTLVAGLGCERGAEAAEILELIRESLAAEGLSEKALACLASIDLKEDEAGILEAAAVLGLPLRLYGAEELERQTPRVTEPSNYVFETVGCHSVSEAAALAGAGEDGTLMVAKRKSARATCAIGRSTAIIDVDQVGRGPGRLVIVGIGPGSAGWRAPDATSAIAACTDLVGYGLYMDLLGGLADGKQRHDYPLGEERERVAHALDLAAAGCQVAIISSGDAGIYAMGSLVYELIDHAGEEGGNEGWRRLAVEMVPGISALQAAAARTGAPLGHDFCTISLSDLMTPWDAIERRIRAAAEGNFVIAFYNPVSKRRRKQFEAARAILQDHRPPATPVIIARNLGRPEEHISVVELQHLETDMVDMLTVVLVGSSETRLIAGNRRPVRVYTPRGYGDKKP